VNEFSNVPQIPFEAKGEEEAIKGEERGKGNIDDEVSWVKTISARVWFQLAHWAKVYGHFETNDRNLLFNIGKKVKFNFKYPPSLNQARQAKKLFEKAKQLGFKPE
jgi:hypothetical protein